MIRWLDGNKAYLHAVLDNFSRRILAWYAAETFKSVITAQLVCGAADTLSTGKPTMLVDGGAESLHSAVDEMNSSNILRSISRFTD